MKRSPLARKTSLKSSGPIKPKWPPQGSREKRTKRKSRGKLPDAVQQAIRHRSMGRCEAGVAPDCTGRGEHFHHRQLRSAGGGNTVENLADLCHLCHGWVHAHPDWARRHGWIVPSWTTPEVTSPVAGHPRACDGHCAELS